jgi:HlyD family secretion protein
MRRVLVIVLLLLAAAVTGVLAWWWTHRPQERSELTLHGNVDLRQVDLAFNNSERIAQVLFQEGDVVKQGQVLARLQTSRLEPQVAEARAQAEAQRQVVLRLQHGSRPEEIAQAQANLESARAEAANAALHYERQKSLFETSGGKSVIRQDVDNAKAALDMANAQVVVNEKALELARAGPREEDIAQAQAQLSANEARLKLLQQQWADAELTAPVNAVVRTRLLEPGDMASPTKPVFSLALTDPKWVRAYVSETDLGLVHPGAEASVAVDAYPRRRFAGWVGFVSPMAEFTPKSVQTEELRTSLVYEVRVFVNDPNEDLRLGMPATVHLPLTQDGPAPPLSSTSAPATTTAPEALP